jgi:hypothetical protein
VAYVYCGSAHLFEDCSANHVSINYVRNFGKNNNPFSQTYNPGRKNHPNFSWANAQNQQKPQSPQSGYAAQNNSQLETILKNFIQDTKFCQ